MFRVAVNSKKPRNDALHKDVIMRVPVDELIEIATKILLQASQNQVAAKKVASRLVTANVTGHDRVLSD